MSYASLTASGKQPLLGPFIMGEPSWLIVKFLGVILVTLPYIPGADRKKLHLQKKTAKCDEKSFQGFYCHIVMKGVKTLGVKLLCQQ